ncbi:cytochrome P450 [Exidia glandulosa HHB12029]|uniref:Cytochrome P450 n=1 Tax=Exidia glandulosa HHB12029 TaxID=1314781 RepID=A0A165QFV9_EXIGL|nr:cytochrome P450 [Exidia glandulosa HHB12029]
MSQMLLENVTAGNVLVAVGVCLAGSSILNAWRKPRYPSSLPRVGRDDKSILSGLKGFMHVGGWLQDGYEKYNKADKAFVLPGVLGTQAEVIVPMSQMQWLVEQPDNVLSTSAAHYDALNGDYSFLTPRLLEHPYHEHVVHRNLARNLNALIPALDDEVRRCMDDAFGTDTENWTSVNVWDTLLAIVPRITNRMMVGELLCRNNEYLDNMVGFTNDVVRNMILFNFIPRPLRPVFGPVLALANYYHYSKTAKHTLPLVKQRMVDLERKDAGDPAYDDWEAPNDYITWHIRQATADGLAEELDPVRVTMRLVPLNFAAIHTTVMTAHGTLLDLISADPARGYLDGIREEAARVLADEGGVWNKNALAKMYRADSAVRESMRVSNFAKILVQRKVVAREGVANPSEGWHVPYGGTISLPLHGNGHDGENFEHPEEYDAFRNSRGREEFEARGVAERDPDEGLKLKRQSLVTTGNTHISFGHGRHACPGRFFVAHELKMILAYLVLNYDVKPLPERPATKWIGLNTIPATDARIEVKRRTNAFTASS